MRSPWSLALLALCLATPALASGVDIAWDNCLGKPACRFLISHGKTSLCAGCSEPVSVTAIVRVANMTITDPISQNVALWQSLPTAARTTSWSALKRLYH